MSFRDWKVGDRVLCINDSSTAFLVPGITYVEGLHGLRAGRVYTIRGFHLNAINGDVCVFLEQIVRPIIRKDRGEVGYFAARFRKIEPRKTDLSCFTAMLNGAKEREKA